jgi:CubicO group peptidase (beta-lactamase class C family)
MNTRLVFLLPMIALGSGCHTSRLVHEPIPASSTVGTQDGRTERIGQVVRETMRRQKVPGISVAVIDHGQLVWAQGFGLRDVERRLPVDTNTQFQAGSISKPVSALGVLLLSGVGKVELDRDVNSYLKGWHLASRYTNVPVTLRQLLCHRAGMVPHGFQGFRETRTPPSLLDVLTKHYFLNGPVRVKYLPGSRNKYSGGGYCVAQKVVEDVTAEPFEVAMSQLLLQPLRMSRSDFHQPPSDTMNTARGYGGVRSLIFPGRWRCRRPKQEMRKGRFHQRSRRWH